MTEDQSIVGQRRIYYDQNEGEALICSDSDHEDVNNEEEDKKEFDESEDKFIRLVTYSLFVSMLNSIHILICKISRSCIELSGSSDHVYDLLARHLSRKPCEIKVISY